MGILRANKITGLGGANAITGSTFFGGGISAESGSAQQNNLQLDISSDFNLGTNNFTIEAFIYLEALGQFNNILAVGTDSTNGYRMDLGTGNNLRFVTKLGSDSWGVLITGGTTFIKNKWYHVAVTRSGNSFDLWVDGTKDATTVTNSGAVLDATVSNAGGGTNNIGVEIGSLSTYAYSRKFNGYISNLHLVNGTALYTSNYTTPTTRLEKRSDTVILACNSAGNVLNEETGKTITKHSANKNSQGPVASRFTPNSPVGFSTTTDVGTQFGSTFDGVTTFDSQAYMVPPGGNTRERNRGRGVMSGGETPSRVNTITFTHIQSSGNFQDFGDLIGGDAGETRGVGSSTRGVFFTNHGGSSGQAEDLEFITFANQSNGTDFGDLPTDHPMRGSAGNETRGIFAGGYKLSLKNEIEFITIATTGNGTDFGNLTGTRNAVAGLASPTRALFGGGSSPTNIDNIDVITIATTGDASDFGDLTRTGKEMGGVASNTRGVFGGARINPSTASNVIDFVTIASAGNAIDFGDLTQIVASPASVTDSIRGLFAGGYTPSPSFSRFNSIDFINIATTGNASDFGDLTYAQNYGGGCSDSHGGL